MGKEERKKAMQNFILGLLFEFDIQKENKQEVAKGISEDIIGYHVINDKDTFQKVALGHLSQFSDAIDDKQMIAISKKIAHF